eukprot:tig00000829_g4656.t1
MATNPNVVGNAFVRQYYMLLASNPNSLHRFYKEESVFTFSEEDAEKSTDTAVGQKNIHEKILSLDFKDCKPQISFVDSQTSLSGGVIVMVTGYLANKNSAPRRFAQTFFLAPQQNGFYVLNDIFRFLQPEATSAASADLTAHPVPEPVQTVVSHSAPPKTPAQQPLAVATPAAPTPAQAPAQAPAQPAPAAATRHAAATAIAAPASAPVDSESRAATGSSTPVQVAEDSAAASVAGGKKTYASILSTAAAANALEKPKESRPQATAPRPSTSTPQPAPGQHAPITEDRSGIDDAAEDEKRSVFVGNLPTDVYDMPTVESKLRALFAKYGTITGVTIRTDKNYGFVDFETPEAVVKLLADATRPALDGKELKVETRQSKTRGGAAVVAWTGQCRRGVVVGLAVAGQLAVRLEVNEVQRMQCGVGVV